MSFPRFLLFQYWLHLAVGRLSQANPPHTAFPSRFPHCSPSVSKAFSERFQSAFRRKVRAGTFLSNPIEPSTKGCRRIIGSKPKVNANCFNLKLYLGCSSWHFGHRVRTLGAPAAISRKGFVLLAFQLPFLSKGFGLWVL